MAEIAFLELDAAEMDHSSLKNQFILQEKSEYLAISNYNRISQKRMLDKITQEDLLQNGDILVFCSGASRDVVELSMRDVLRYYPLEIIGVVFRKSILYKAGKYNEKLGSLTDFELICRLTEFADRCLYVFDDIEELPLTISEADLFSYAYLLRRYLQKMHSWQMTETVLTGMYQLAQEAGMQSVFQRNLSEMLSDTGVYEQVAWNTAPYAIFRGNGTCYGVLRDFADSLAAGLREIGQSVLILEPGQIDYDYLEHSICKGFVGFQTEAFGIDFFRKLSGYKIQFWFDNPVFYMHKFATIPDDCYIMCQDTNYVSFIKERYHMKNVFHMPPGGHVQEWNPSAVRPYDIIFIGGYATENNESLAGFEREYYDYMLKNPNKTFSEGLSDLTNDENIAELLTDLKPVCQSIVDHFRKEVIDIILQAGYELHVYGKTWDAYHSLWEERLIRHPEVTVEESLREWQKAKIGLNVMSWHKAGMTERVANIMLAGAVCLSDETDYLKQSFSDGEQMVCYNLERLEELPAKIAALLKDDNWKQIAEGGYEAALEKHTWKRRAIQLTQFVEKRNGTGK